MLWTYNFNAGFMDLPSSNHLPFLCPVLQAPMSARKFAWEAKIAEQQNVASEHNRIMYRTRSATRLTGGSCQKQEAEDQLRHGQEKVYDPAERVRGYGHESVGLRKSYFTARPA